MAQRLVGNLEQTVVAASRVNTSEDGTFVEEASRRVFRTFGDAPATESAAGHVRVVFSRGSN